MIRLKESSFQKLDSASREEKFSYLTSFFFLISLEFGFLDFIALLPEKPETYFFIILYRWELRAGPCSEGLPGKK